MDMTSPKSSCENSSCRVWQGTCEGSELSLLVLGGTLCFCTEYTASSVVRTTIRLGERPSLRGCSQCAATLWHTPCPELWRVQTECTMLPTVE